MSDNTQTPPKGFIISNDLYDKAKWFVMIVLPAFSTLYFTLGTIWGWPNVVQVVGSIAAFSTFIGIVVGISTKSYNVSDRRFDGYIDISENEDGATVFMLNLNADPELLEHYDSVSFKVNRD